MRVSRAFGAGARVTSGGLIEGVGRVRWMCGWFENGAVSGLRKVRGFWVRGLRGCEPGSHVNDFRWRAEDCGAPQRASCPPQATINSGGGETFSTHPAPWGHHTLTSLHKPNCTVTVPLPRHRHTIHLFKLTSSNQTCTGLPAAFLIHHKPALFAHDIFSQSLTMTSFHRA